MKLNDCNYSEGGKHDCCSHAHYCIFNKKRWILETKIRELEKTHKEFNRLRVSFIVGNYTGSVEYDDLLRMIKVTEIDLKNLSKYRTKILNGEVQGYGYEVLES